LVAHANLYYINTAITGSFQCPEAGWYPAATPGMSLGLDSDETGREFLGPVTFSFSLGTSDWEPKNSMFNFTLSTNSLAGLPGSGSIGGLLMAGYSNDDTTSATHSWKQRKARTKAGTSPNITSVLQFGFGIGQYSAELPIVLDIEAPTGWSCSPSMPFSSCRPAPFYCKTIQGAVFSATVTTCIL
jgi:hypothetical protein